MKTLVAASHYAQFEGPGLPDRKTALTAPSQDFIDRLEARLALLNEQIIKLSALAAKASDEELQEKYWNAAQDVSREARELRKYLANIQQNS